MTLDPQTRILFVFISSVGVQRRNAFTWVQKGPVNDQMDRLKITKGLQKTGQTDEQAYYTATQRIWTRIMRPHLPRAIMS